MLSSLKGWMKFERDLFVTSSKSRDLTEARSLACNIASHAGASSDACRWINVYIVCVVMETDAAIAPH